MPNTTLLRITRYTHSFIYVLTLIKFGPLPFSFPLWVFVVCSVFPLRLLLCLLQAASVFFVVLRFYLYSRDLTEIYLSLSAEWRSRPLDGNAVVFTPRQIGRVGLWWPAGLSVKSLCGFSLFGPARLSILSGRVLGIFRSFEISLAPA